MKKKIIVMLMLLMAMNVYSKERYSSYLLGDEKGKVYYEDNIDEVHPLASVTKMVNLMVVYDKLESGEIQLTDMVAISEKARNIGGSRIWIGKGSSISVEELIKATAIFSANNAAYALAEYISDGEVDKFIGLMNDKVIKAGAEGKVQFHTPTGLPPHMTGEKMDVGTAEGIYLMSIEALKYPEYIKIASMKEAVIQGSQKIQNRNKLISKESGVYGIKTGHHGTAGYNISIVSERNNNKAITVVFGSPTENVRNKVAMELINGFYNEYQVKKIVDSNKALGVIKIEKGVEEEIKVYPMEDFYKFVSNKWNVDIESNYNERIVAPIKKGEIIGNYKVSIEGEVVYRGDLYADRDIERENKIKEIFKEIFRNENSKAD